MYARIIAALLCCAGVAPIALGQQAPEPCGKDESIEGCYDRIQRTLSPAADVEATTADQKEAVNKELEVAETGADAGGAATAATMNDLAQLLNALGLVSSGEGSDASKIVLDLNFLLPVQDVENNNTQLKGTINTEPEPLDQLVQAFGEDVREARKDSLQKDIAALGDAQIAFTWGLVNTRFGRDFSVLRRNIALMNQGAVSRVYSGANEESERAFGNLVAKAARARLSSVDPISGLALSEDEKQQYRDETFKAAMNHAEVTQGIEAEVARAGLDKLADLVEQQPQLLFTLEHDFRDEIVGPETTSATVTWEFTRRNLGSFMRNEGRVCTEREVATGTSDQYNRCVSALQKYIADYASDLQNQPRFKVEASFKRVESVTYSFPEDGIDLTLPQHDRWEVAVAAGGPLSKDRGRVDFELSYDSNLDDDDSNKERVTASLTYTRRVGDMDMPFSIVYANKNEFLGEVDHQISLNLGLKFRQPDNQ